ncbi:MAG: hypothetical protein HZA54_20270 [Planctomycetes bacterium]|nr:hypothetical protein [Planctomycetota bacterium]
MTPADALNDIQRMARELPGRVELGSIGETLEEAERGLDRADAGVRELRERGYSYDGGLEADLAHARNDLIGARPQVQAAWMRARQEAAYRLQPLLGAAAGAPALAAMAAPLPPPAVPGQPGAPAPEAPPQLVALRAELERLGSDLQSAAYACEKPLAPATERLGKVRSRIEVIAGVLKLAEEHGLQTAAGEGLVNAVKATWLQDAHKLEGALFLTDQRVAFSWAEEVIVEKGWIFNKTKKVYQLKVNQPLASLTQATSSEKGLVFKDELLDLTFTSGPVIKLKLGADSDGWKAGILRAKSGDVRKQRVGQVAIPARVAAPPAPPRAPSPLMPPAPSAAAFPGMPVMPAMPAMPGAPSAASYPGMPPGAPVRTVPGGAAPFGIGGGGPGVGGYPGAPAVPGGYPMPGAAPGWGGAASPGLPGAPGWPGVPVPGAAPMTGYPGGAPPGYPLPGGQAPGMVLPGAAPGMPAPLQPLRLGPAQPGLPTIPGTLMPYGAQGLQAVMCGACGAPLIAPPQRGVNLQCPHCRGVGSV